MAPATQRVNVTLDGEHAAKLARLDARVHVNEGTLPFAAVLRDRGRRPDADNIVTLLDRTHGALDRAELGRRQAIAGETVGLDEL